MMKNFLVIYNSTPADLAEWNSLSPEQKGKAMEGWMAWKNKNEQHIVDFGAPLMGGQNVSADQSWRPSHSEVSGYSVLKANSIQELQATFVDHPHLAAGSGSTIEVREFAPM